MSNVNFRYDTLSVGRFIEEYELGKIIIPKYQRSIKWKEDRRKNLISSIKKGNPMGAVLLYKTSTEMKVIDGLQRLSTIVHYMNNPLLYLTKEEITEEDIKELNNDIYDNTKLKYEDSQIKELLYSNIDFHVQKNKDNNISDSDLKDNIADSILNELQITNNRDIIRKLDRIIDKIQGNQLKDYPLHYIEYTGDEENLPEIFHALNTGAMNLTKYEVISSTWNDTQIKISNSKTLEKLNTKIIEKYEKMRVDGFEFNFEDEQLISDDSIYLFDFCEAFSKIISKQNNNYLFAKKDDNEIAFELLSLIFHNKKITHNDEHIIMKFTQPEKLMYILNDKTNPREIEKLIDSIEKTINQINSILKKFMYKTDKMNSKIPGYMSKHLFLTIYNEKYKIELYNNELEVIEQKNKITKYENNLKLRIIDDFITNYWSKNRQQNDFISIIESGENRYKETIATDRLVMNFNTYLYSIINDEVTKYAKKDFDEQTKIIAYMLHTYKMETDNKYMKYYNNKNSKLDFDHYYAKSWFTEIKDVPYSSLLNCWPIPSEDNKQKNNKNVTKTENTNYKSSEFNEILNRDEIEHNFANLDNKEKKRIFNKSINNYKNTLENLYIELISYYKKN